MTNKQRKINQIHQWLELFEKENRGQTECTRAKYLNTFGQDITSGLEKMTLAQLQAVLSLICVSNGTGWAQCRKHTKELRRTMVLDNVVPLRLVVGGAK